MSDVATIGRPGRRLGVAVGRALLAALLIGPAIAYLVLGIAYNLVPAGPGLLNTAGNATGTDFIAFYAAAQALWQQGVGAVYDIAALNAVEDAVLGVDINPVTFHYPPPYLFVVAPLAAMPYLPALGAWLGGLTALYLFALRKLGAPLLIVVLLVAFPGTVQSIITGQNGLLTAALLAGGLALLDRHPRWSGVVFALMIYKPHLAALVPLCLLAGRRHETFAAMAATGALLIAASTLAFGVDAWRLFFDGLPASLNYVIDGRVPFERMPTVFVTAFQATDSIDVARIAQGLSTILTVAACLAVWRRCEDPAIRALALTAGVPLVSPYGFDYDLAILAIPLVLFAIRPMRRDNGLRDPILICLLWAAPVLFWLVSRALDQQVGPILFAGLLAVALRNAINPKDRPAPAR